MYLSRLFLAPTNRAVRADIADCQSMHRTVMRAFGRADADARAAFGVLHRLERPRRDGAIPLLVQSRLRPDWGQLPQGYLLEVSGEENPACKDVAAAYAALRDGQALAFRLLANVTRKVDTKTRPDGQRSNGRRVPLSTEAERIDWLRRRGQEGGFVLLGIHFPAKCSDDERAAIPNVRVLPVPSIVGRRPLGDASPGTVNPLTFAAVLFEGVLRMVDARRFNRTLRDGIGPGKGYGFGLMSVAVVRE